MVGVDSIVLMPRAGAPLSDREVTGCGTGDEVISILRRMLLELSASEAIDIRSVVRTSGKCFSVSFWVTNAGPLSCEDKSFGLSALLCLPVVWLYCSSCGFAWLFL